MGSGLFLQPQSTVPRNCAVGFGINESLEHKSKPELHGIGEGVFPPSGTLSTGLAAACLGAH